MKIAKRAAALVVFVALLVGVMSGVNWLFQMKKMDGCYPVQMFYKQEKNTVDVLCLGSSHTYTNINPAVLWDEYGIASYDLAGSNQPLWNTYYYFKEALKYQTPELVVVDVYRAVETEDYQEEARVVMNTFGLRYSKDWAENLKVSLSPTASYMDYFLRFPVYHSRYQELKQMDFQLYNGDVNRENYKGFNLNSISTQVFGEYPDVSSVTEVGKMTEKTREYLEKIILLAQENDVPLLLVSAPYMGVLEDKEIYNQVELVAETYGVEFIDFNEHYTDIGLDLKWDFAEWSHLNYSGSEKYTQYLGKLIEENYEVSDRRGDARYDSWEKNARFYEKQAANVALIKSENKEEYFEKLFAESERYTICVNIAGNMKKKDKKKLKKLLKKYGMDMMEDSTWVFKGGELLYSLPVDQKITEDSLFYKNLGSGSISVSVEMGYDDVRGNISNKIIAMASIF